MPNPIQPIITDAHGRKRFKANAIVRHLFNTHPSCNMSTLAEMDFTDDDRRQFAQLIGYSLYGYSELTYYVRDRDYNEAASETATDELPTELNVARLKAELDELRDAIAALRAPFDSLFSMVP